MAYSLTSHAAILINYTDNLSPAARPRNPFLQTACFCVHESFCRNISRARRHANIRHFVPLKIQDASKCCSACNAQGLIYPKAEYVEEPSCFCLISRPSVYGRRHVSIGRSSCWGRKRKDGVSCEEYAEGEAEDCLPRENSKG